MNFVFDLDGTICFKGEPMSQDIVQALHAVEDDGHRVIFASARPIRDMLPVIHPSFHDHILIGGNGSLVASEQTIVQSNRSTIVSFLLSQNYSTSIKPHI